MPINHHCWSQTAGSKETDPAFNSEIIISMVGISKLSNNLSTRQPRSVFEPHWILRRAICSTLMQLYYIFSYSDRKP
ncbi:hypothetical protein, partial [Paenochrobactrum sp. BZR 588]|uniref:hypothetical protein n=1 Tax=Paenochrobactrum sp. BZR 588 TaxID=3378076 RepID=UPI003857831A